MFHFETGKVRGTYFERCDMNDVTISYALCIKKNTVYNTVLRHQFHRGVNPSVVIRSIESKLPRPDNIDGYIIKVNRLCI